MPKKLFCGWKIFGGGRFNLSADFIKMIVDLKNERYLNQMKNLIGNKIPCGLFFDFNVVGNVSEIIGQLKNIGVNLTCACFIDNQVKESVEYPGGGILSL